MSKRRVVVTGLGVVSPLGSDCDTAWSNAVAGCSGVVPISRFDASQYPCRVAGEVRGFDVSHYLTAKEVRHFDAFIHYGVGAGAQALKNSGFEITESNADRVGAIIGSGIGGLSSIEKEHDTLRERGVRRVSPFFIPSTLINMVSGQLSILYGFKGPTYGVVSACTSGLHAIGDAMRMITCDDADVMLAGGAEAAISPLGVSGFSAARALSTRYNDSPEFASRPWDRERDGFVLAEGAGMLLLEEYEHAKKRGAVMYAEILGVGMTSDANHITAPTVDGPKRCMLMAIRSAGINTHEVDYVNAHGTSTPLGDKNETQAIKAAFGESDSRRLVVSATKSMTGHLLGGAAGVEMVFTVLSVYKQIALPTINQFVADPECDLDYCANESRDLRIRFALKNSFGFGGTNGSIVLGALN